MSGRVDEVDDLLESVLVKVPSGGDLLEKITECMLHLYALAGGGLRHSSVHGANVCDGMRSACQITMWHVA